MPDCKEIFISMLQFNDLGQRSMNIQHAYYQHANITMIHKWTLQSYQINSETTCIITTPDVKWVKYNFTFSLYLLYGVLYLANTTVVMQVTILCEPDPITLQ